MTREEAITNHRKMWQWMADESRRRGTIVTKKQYFLCNDKPEVWRRCYLCDYVHNLGKASCNNCPIVWPYNTGEHPLCTSSYFRLYNKVVGPFVKRYEQEDPLLPIDIEMYAFLCEIIANLPEREEENDQTTSDN